MSLGVTTHRGAHQPHPWWLVWFILVSWFTPGLQAANPTPGLSARKVEISGLPHRTVLALLEDREGFLWIGTSDGLARFDGIDAVVYRYDPFDPHGLDGGAVTALLEDKRGVFWVGTNNGLQTFDRKRQQFSKPGVSVPHAELDGANVSFALEDHGGHLWFGTIGSGLFQFDPIFRDVTHYTAHATSRFPLGHDVVRAGHVDNAGDLWILVGSGDRLSIQRIDEEGRFQTVAIDVPTSWTLFVDKSGKPWADSRGPLPLIDSKRTRGGSSNTDRTGGRRNEIWAIAPASNGNLWFGTNTGLFLLDPTAESLPEHMVEFFPGGYLDTFVRTVLVGRSGILWVGTQGGLFAVDPRAKSFHHCLIQPEATSGGLRSAAVSAIVEDSDETLWVGTFGSGLLHVNRKCQILARFDKSGKGTGFLPDNVVWDLALDGDDGLWIAAGDLARFDLSSGRMDHHSMPDEMAAQVVQCGPNDEVWTGSHGGLAHYDPASRNLLSVPLEQASEPGTLLIDSLDLDDDGVVWAGSPESIYRYDPATASVQRLPLTTPDATSLRSTGTWTMVTQKDGAVWLGTAVGLARHVKGTDSASLILAGGDLPGSSVFSILPDETGTLWLATNRGLARYDPKSSDRTHLKHYSSIDGLGNVEFNRHAAFVTRDGTLFFGGLDGLTWFHPAEIKDNDFVPPVRLTGIEIIDSEGTRKISPHGLDRLELGPSDVMLDVQFAALSFTNPLQNRYAYRLQGFDPQWIDAGHRRFAQYSRLPPGKYLLRIRGCNNDGLWNEEGLELEVVVLPAWWQTLWFKALVGILLAGVLFAVRNYRVAKARDVQQLRLGIAGDLHDDLSSDLSGVAVVADMLRKHPSLDEPQREDLVMIRDTAVRMVDGIRDIVWYIDPEHDSVTSMVDRMRSVAERLLRGTVFTFDVTGSGRVPVLTMEIRKDLYLVFKEALQNVARHANAHEVKIELFISRRQVRLTIKDDGAGFDSAMNTGGTGLRSMRRRAHQLGSSLEVLAAPGSGTLIILDLDLTKTRDGRALSDRDTLQR